jgi:uncharacterized phage protein (TIGR02218 family)
MTKALASGATHLCWCLKLTTTDGTVLGFTDHDVDVTCDGVTYKAETGFSLTQKQQYTYKDDLKVLGALSTEAIREEDIAAGRYDGASVELYRVNWSSPDQRFFTYRGIIGKVQRGKSSYIADVHGLIQQLRQPIGRSYCYLCDADVGDSRCGLDITASTYKGTATVTAVTDNRRYTVSGLSGFANEWFGGGKLTWTSGNNSGLSIEVKRHTKTSASVIIEAWQSAPKTVAVGDTFAVTVGCDKSFATCKSKFSNGVNHRGFPYMIGNDSVVAYAYGDTDLDGGSRYGN